MDKVDGPYYFFKLIRRIRGAVPAVAADARRRGPRDQHRPGRLRRQGDGPHRPPRRPRRARLPPHRPATRRTAGEVIDIFARAAHAPQSSVRLPAGAIEALAAAAQGGARRRLPLARHRHRPRPRRLRDPALGPHLRQLPDPLRLAPDPGRARGHRTSRCRRSRPTPASSGTTGSATSTPTCTATARSSGPRGAGSGWSAASPRSLEQQIPDELLRLGRSVRGNAPRSRRRSAAGSSWSPAPRRGSASRRRMKIADAGGIVLLVARTPEKLEETRDQIEAGGGIAYVHRVRPLRHRRHRPDGRRGARPARPRRRPRQQRRPLDPALDRALLRPLPRLRADDAAQLLRAR